VTRHAATLAVVALLAAGGFSVQTGSAARLAFSPDGRWLYSTSEAEGAGSKNVGSLAVIDVAEAEKDPARSVVARTAAG
jgi:hypothetical protein